MSVRIVSHLLAAGFGIALALGMIVGVTASPAYAQENPPAPTSAAPLSATSVAPPAAPVATLTPTPDAAPVPAGVDNAVATASPLPSPGMPRTSERPDSSGTSEDGSTGLGQLMDLLREPDSWIAGTLNRALLALAEWTSAMLREWIERLCCGSTNFFTTTPPALTYANPSVRGLWEWVRGVANAALVLVAAWTGINLIVRDHLGASYHEAMEVFVRLALGTLLVNTSLWWTQLAIDVNNALGQAVTGSPLPAWQNASPADRPTVTVVVVLVYLVAALLLLLQQLARLALVDLLLVLAPLGLLCWILPQTQGWARLWSGTFFGAVFTQFVQAVALRVGSSLVGDHFGLAAGDGPGISLLLGIAVLLLTLRVPSLMRVAIGDGLGLARYYVYRRTAGALGLGSRPGGSGSGIGGTRAASGGAP